MTREEFESLDSAPLREAVAANLDRDPLRIALDRRIPQARLVASQVKCLRRARTKLPTYYAAGCILPPRAFEQASSEACAAHKAIEGRSVLDLTCGLGVDALFLARRFDRVVALERDPVLAAVTAANFRRLGADRIEIVCTTAEAYLASTDEHFDWIYADPDRRTDDARKQVRLEACSPDIRSLMPLIERTAQGLCLKNSPLFDVDEALRLFPRSRVEAVSLDGECKEVMIYADGRPAELAATAIGTGSITVPVAQIDRNGTTRPFDPRRYAYLVIPDVALQKSRLACHALRGTADIWDDNGYAFAVERPDAAMGRIEPIERIEPFDPKRLRKEWKGRGAEILKRDFPWSIEQIRSRTGLRPGDELRLAFTRIGPEYWTIQLGRRR